MSDIILELRGAIDDATSAVWTDDELQDVLDQHRLRVWREPMEMERTLVSASDYEYKVYHSRWRNFESGGTAYFQVEGADGTQRGTADYTVNYIAGVVSMTADQEGSALYLSGWSYDLNAAAADCWRQRASKVSSYYDVQADGHRLSRSQWFAHCRDLAQMYANQARPITVRQWRNGLFDDE